MAADASAETCAGILEQTGRECAKLGQLGVRFKADPEGYFAAAKQNWGTEMAWDKETGGHHRGGGGRGIAVARWSI